MHINSHYAVGLLFGILSHHYYGFDILIILIIIGAAFVQDVDIIFSASAPEKNHRMLITHSIWPATMVLIIAFVLNISWLIIAGFALLSHTLIDMLDWGTNIFYTGKIYGARFLLPEEDRQHLKDLVEKDELSHSFFTQRYYHSIVFRLIELVLISSVVLLMITTRFPYYWLGFLYIPFFGFHTLMRRTEEKRAASLENRS